jgi:hypothetical protein
MLREQLLLSSVFGFCGGLVIVDQFISLFPEGQECVPYLFKNVLSPIFGASVCPLCLFSILSAKALDI